MTGDAIRGLQARVRFQNENMAKTPSGVWSLSLSRAEALQLLEEWDGLAKAYYRESKRQDEFYEALRAICTSNDSGRWINVYRAAGGGYEGLQAIAREALGDDGPGAPFEDGL